MPTHRSSRPRRPARERTGALAPIIPGAVASAATPADIEPLIVTVRGARVILSNDLARVYGVLHRALNQAVRRNATRFPADFAFRLTLEEARHIAGLRSQSVTLKDESGPRGARSRSQSVILIRGANIKYAPLAFTEHGALMAATVLNSPRAVQMSVFVVRAFLRLRRLVAGQGRLAARLAKLERRVSGHDHELQAIVRALRELLDPAPEPPRRRIGFAREPTASA